MEPTMRFQILALLCLVGTVQNNLLVSGEEFTIVHWNDVGGQLQRFSPGTGESSLAPSTPCDEERCVGGLSNLVHYINESTAGLPSSNVFKLTSGNLASGENGWLSVLGWDKYGTLLRDFYQPTAMSLGIKDFGAGLSRTNSYLGANKVVLTNVNCKNSLNGDEKEFCGKVETMHQLSSTIGLLGFVNPNVMKLASPGDLQFEDIVTALKAEVVKHPSIKTFIALGDGSLEISKKIIESVPQVKLVIYGMGFGTSKNMAGDYPMVYKNGIIATAGRYGSSIGKIVLDVGTNGDVKVVPSSSKLIPTVGLELEMVASKTVNDFAAEVNNANGTIGQTIFKLQGGETCWRQECNLGNLVTDAMVHCAYTKSPMSLIDKTPVVSIWHGGALFNDVVVPKDDISHLDIHKWLPYHNRAHLVTIQGSNLQEVFAAGAKGINANVTAVSDWGQFLQVSNGLEVYYNTRGKEPILEKIRILHEEDSTPRMMDLDMNKKYYVVIPSMILEGRSVFDFAKNYWTKIANIDFDDECLKGYITALNKVTIGFEERIWINAENGGGGAPCPGGGGGGDNNTGGAGSSTTVTVIVTIVIMTVIIATVVVGYFFVYPKLVGRRVNSNGNEFSNFRTA